MQRQQQLEEELTQKQGSKMNKASRKILEQRELRLKLLNEGPKEVPKEDAQQAKPQIRPGTAKNTSQKSTWGAPKKPVEQKTGPNPTTENTFAPKVNKMPASVAAKRGNKKIEEMLYEDARIKKEKQAELEKQQAAKTQQTHLKISDKFILSRFNKMFKATENTLHGQTTTEEENGQAQGTTHQVN